MNLEEALRAYLLADAGIAVLVGTRVYPVQLAQNATLPAITYQRITTSLEHHRNMAEAGRIRFQIDFYAANYGGAVAGREAVRAAMATFTRSTAPRVDVALLQDDRDLRDPETNRWRASMDYMLFAEQS